MNQPEVVDLAVITLSNYAVLIPQTPLAARWCRNNIPELSGAIGAAVLSLEYATQIQADAARANLTIGDKS